MIGEVAPRRVLFVGDSLVAGVGDPAGAGWVARITSACFRQGVPLTAYNLGVRGQTSVQVAARWQLEATARAPAGSDARVVVSFGANDTMIEGAGVRVAADRSCRELAAILDRADALGFAAFVVGPAPVADAEHNRRLGALTLAFAQICAERDTPFVGTFEPLLGSAAWMAEVRAGDGAHPQAGGYDALAELLIDRGLPAWLAQPSARSVRATPDTGIAPGAQTSDRTSRHHARVIWRGEGDDVRAHEAQLADQTLACSCAVAWGGDPAKADPEEMFVAALSSCHMLWFLDLARRERLRPLSYEDEAEGEMDGRRFVRVVLRPRVTFAGEVGAEATRRLHDRAHAACFIASSVSCPVIVEPA